jgi:hypothetical protein
VQALRLAAAAVLFAGLAACSSIPSEPTPSLVRGEIVTPPGPLYCVGFARERSGVDIHGDAWTWWDQADGRYARESDPETGAVMVLTGYAGEKRAHLAVVRETVSPRLIRVDHANWLNDGRIYLDDPVADVSPDNDWSEVRVYNLRDGGWGLKTYQVKGFIAPRAESPDRLLASRQ